MAKSTMARWLRCMVLGGWVLQACSAPSSSAATTHPAREPVVDSNDSSIAGTGEVALAPPGAGLAPPGAGATGASAGARALGSNPPATMPGAMAGARSPSMQGASGTGANVASDMIPVPAAGSNGSQTTVPPTEHAGKTCLKPGDGSYGEPGPYQVGMMEVDLGMIEPSQNTGKFTIYYPNPLEADCLYPIVAWGNGTGVQGQGVYAFLNSNAAAWGMVVAESEEDNTGSGNFHKAGLDYLLAQNQDPSSMFYQKLSTRAGVSGHSQGGFGASMGSSHPNVETMAIEGASSVATAKVSVLILTGTEDIVTNPESLVAGAAGPMFVANWEGGDHFTTETLGGYVARDAGSLQFQRLYAAWFRCFLADDDVACTLFSGGTPQGCGICSEPGWHSLSSKNL